GQSEARKQVFQALWNAQGGGGSDSLIPWRELIQNAAADQLKFNLKTQNGVPSVLDAVIDGATDPKVKSALCSAFMDRFGLSKAQIGRCPVTAESYKECIR
ncbi:MAG: hypothetical protein HY901_04605, partial [Deltaproteobacteria bacterium]|nr:hypothetical protein [Deltaproteobacteria bacterium]